MRYNRPYCDPVINRSMLIIIPPITLLQPKMKVIHELEPFVFVWTNAKQRVFESTWIKRIDEEKGEIELINNVRIDHTNIIHYFLGGYQFDYPGYIEEEL